MGLMLSPVHLCFLVTKDYFRASLLGRYRYFSLSAFSVMGAAVVLFLNSRTFEVVPGQTTGISTQFAGVTFPLGNEGILIFLLTRFQGEDTIETVIADDLF